MTPAILTSWMNIQERVNRSLSMLKTLTNTAIRCHTDPTIRGYLIAQKDRVGAMLNDLETIYLPQITKDIDGQPRTWATLGLQPK